MTIRDMHIEVQQSLNQVAANRTRKLFPEEIDWVLNKQYNRFIQSCLVPKRVGNQVTGGFEIDQLKAEAIQPLLVSGKILKAYIDRPTRYKCILPPDYGYLISDASLTNPLCGAAPTIGNETILMARLRQSLSVKPAPPFYLTQVATIGSKVVSIPADLPYGHAYAGYPELQDVDFLKSYVAHKGGWYWETFDTLSYPKHYLFPVPSSVNPIMVIDGTTAAAGAVTNLAYTYHSGTGKTVPNRLTPSQLIPSMAVSPYWKATPNTPLSELSGGILYVYRDNSFTVNGCEITYIRKTPPLSIGLNTDCELAPGFHSTICDLAVEYFKSRVENEKGTALAEADISKRVIL